MHRFFIPPEALKGPTVALGGTLAHQMASVLRLRPGDVVVFLDNSGWEYESRVTYIERGHVEALILERRLAGTETVLRLHLYQAVLKGEKLELVLQKGTELGLASFTPVLSRRSVAGPPSAGRQERWRHIIQEAAEQSGRARLPPLHPATSLKEALSGSPGLRLFPWEEERSLGLRQALPVAVAEISLFIGPEGGWEPEEVAQAREHGAVAVSLGPRILRAETAGLVAAAAILYHFGELGG